MRVRALLISTALAVVAGCSETSTDTSDAGLDAAPIDAADAGASVVTLATGVAPVPIVMASNGAQLLWVGAGAKDVMSLPVSGGTPSMVAAGVASVPSGVPYLTVDAQNVYVVTAGQGLQRIPLAAPSTPVLQVPLVGTGAIVSNAAKACWMDSPEPSGTTLRCAPFDGGSASVAIGRVSFASATLGLTDSTLIVASLLAAFYSIPLTGGEPSGGQSVEGNYAQLQSAGGVVFGAPLGPGPVVRVAPDGSLTTLVASATGNGMAVDDTYVYWADRVAGLSRVPQAGGAVTKVTSEPVEKVAVDSTAIYWATPKGEIRRLLK